MSTYSPARLHRLLYTYIVICYIYSRLLINERLLKIISILAPNKRDLDKRVV